MMQELVCGESARGVISRVSKSTSVPHQRTIPPPTSLDSTVTRAYQRELALVTKF